MPQKAAKKRTHQQAAASDTSLLKLLDDKVSMVHSLQAAGILNYVPSHCFDCFADTIKFLADSAKDKPLVLKAATSCDSNHVRFGTAAELRQYLETLAGKTSPFERCVIQPNQWENCVLNQDNELCEWRVYAVCCDHKYRIVDQCRLCVSTTKQTGFFKRPEGVVDIPEGVLELTERICTSFKDHMTHQQPIVIGIDFLIVRSTREPVVLEINVDDAITKEHYGANVGLRSFRRVTRGMPIEERAYIDRDTMITHFKPK